MADTPNNNAPQEADLFADVRGPLNPREAPTT
jgi:hypothetical protein